MYTCIFEGYSFSKNILISVGALSFDEALTYLQDDDCINNFYI